MDRLKLPIHTEQGVQNLIDQVQNALKPAIVSRIHVEPQHENRRPLLEQAVSSTFACQSTNHIIG